MAVGSGKSMSATVDAADRDSVAKDHATITLL
jgi:hypothetical protein